MMYIKDMEYKGLDRLHVQQDKDRCQAHVNNSVEHFGSINYWKFLD
jgi:hypothetical protein